jgi:RNA polymerase sigma-70 factor (ECF subfamily)
MVFRTLWRLLGSSDHIEDLAQEVFLRLFRAYDHFRNDAKLSTYIYRIVLNVAQDEWKRRRSERESTYSLSDQAHPWEDRIPYLGKSPEHQVQDMEAQVEIERALQTLSEQERAVLVLFHQEERTYEAIAHILDIPIGTVRTHLHRGRKKLRDAVRRRATSCQTK